MKKSTKCIFTIYPSFYHYSIITYSNPSQGRGSWEKKLTKKNSVENSKIPVPKNSSFDRLRKVSRKLSKGKESNDVAFVKEFKEGKEKRVSKLRPFSVLISPPLPPLPEKSLKFKKLQYEKMLAGKINPPSKNGKVLKKSDIKALLVQINNALKSECKSECDSIYQDPKKVHQ